MSNESIRNDARDQHSCEFRVDQIDHVDEEAVKTAQMRQSLNPARMVKTRPLESVRGLARFAIDRRSRPNR